jgi:DNA-binding IclR family transcriptional regulator
MTDAEIESLLPDPLLPASARLTLRQRDALLAEIRLVRERGYASQVEEFVDGIAALATPVFAAGGRVLGALSIAGPVARFDEYGWASLLLPAASEMSQRCGYQAGRGVFTPNGEEHAMAGAGAGAASRKEVRSPRG